MLTLKKFGLIFLLFTIFLSGCALPPAQGAPMPVSQSMAATASPTYVQAPLNATATPTPFQPLPPTQAYYPTNTPLPTSTQLPPTLTPTPSPIPTQAEARVRGGKRGLQGQPSSQVNILLLGSDQRPWDSNFRTDTIVLATLNTELGKVNLTSFPRDLYVTIPGWGQQRINTAYEYGGFRLLGDTFQANFGFRPDHYVLINFSSFKQVVDKLGGLDVNVHNAVSDYRAGRYVTITPGMHHMDADDVLWYVRTRKTTNDFYRNRRQQEVLNALVDKLLSLNAIKDIPYFYDLYKSSVSTDLSLSDILPLLPLATVVTDSSRLNHYFIGPQQVYDWITYDGGMVLMPRFDQIQQVLQEALNIP